MDAGPSNIPYGLELRASSQQGCGGMGVWTTQTLPAGLRIGPLEGRIVPEERRHQTADPSVAWEVGS